ncbi:hypothetical protein [Stenotrophomonas sp. P5_B8]
MTIVAPSHGPEHACTSLAAAAGDAVVAGRQAARLQADQILASAQTALRHLLGARAGGHPSSSPDGAIPMTFPTPLPSPPDGGRPPHKSPMEIAQELAEAAMAATEQSIRAAMEASQHAIEAANEAARRADAAAEDAVRRATEAAAEDDAKWEQRR